LKPTGKIQARGVPDAIRYDPASKPVITSHHSTNDGTSIDPATEKVVGTNRDFRHVPSGSAALRVRATSSPTLGGLEPRLGYGVLPRG
jgi:hypothetical protein